MAKDHTQYEKFVEQYFNDLPISSIEISKCIFCDNKPHIKLFTKNSMEVHRCECGFVYNRRQANQKALDKFYETSKAMTQWSKIKQTAREHTRQYEKYIRAVSYLERFEIKNILDIGCGTGAFLSMFSKKVDRFGIDQNGASLDVIEDKSIHYENISIDNYFKRNKTQFDAVGLWGVLEHVKDPIGVLRKANSAIRQSGLISICVPNYMSLAFQILGSRCFSYCPQHLWYFTIESLRRALKASKFNILTHWTIEDEIKPIKKALNGLDPYEATPDWLDLDLNLPQLHFKEDILIRKLGYKIVAIGVKYGECGHNPSKEGK